MIIIVIAVSSGSGGGRNIDYIATAKAHTPFAASQNLPYTFAEVFDKYTNNLVWYTDSEDKKADTAIVKADSTVKGTEYRLIVGIKVSPNPNDPDGCLIQPQSVDFDGVESASQGNVADFLYIMFAAYDEGFEDLSDVLSDLDEVSALLTGSEVPGQQINTELTETYSNTDMGITFRYPSDWTLFDESEGSVSISKLVTDYTSGFAANFGVYDLTEDYKNGTLGIDVFTEDVAALEKIYNQQGNTTVLSIEDVTINGVPARVLKYQTGGLNGTDPVITRDYYINRGRVYRIICSCNKSIADTYEKVFDAIIDSFSITLTEEPATEPPQTEPPQLPQAPLPTDYVGTWLDTSSNYEMQIYYEDGLYTIVVSLQLGVNEWRQWNFEGYGDGGGIFYSGGYVDLYLRGDGTVGGGGVYTETDGYMYIAGNWSLYWNDSMLGLPEIQFIKQ